MAERLETRYALAGDLELPPVLPPNCGDCPPPADVSPPPETPPVTPPINPPPTGNTPPIIVEFNFTPDGNWIHFQGFVTDNQDPTGYVVHIWGLVNFNVTVAADDHFSFTIAVTPNISGSISAQTVDTYGLLSNIFTITL
ncbi:MAG: hypothetical protein ACKVP0_09530 [Pirellulaceae bacterium]